MDPGTLDICKTSGLGHLFQSENFIFGASGGGRSWFLKGHYTDGAEMIDEVCVFREKICDRKLT